MKYWKRHQGSWACTNITFILLFAGVIVMGCERSEESTEVGDVVGLTWQWRYDQEGRFSEIEAPGKVTTRVTYTDPEAKAGKLQTGTIEFEDEKRTFTWDPQGRLVSAEGSGGTVAFDHNTAGLPSEVRTGAAPTIRYGYDLQGRLAETRIGNGTVIRYRYDYLGRLATIVTPAGEITYIYHRATNRVIRRLPNGVQTVREYDDEGKLVELTHVDSNSFIIAKYAYVYRPDRLIEGVTETTQRSGEQVCRYKYDLMQRLTGVDCNAEGRSYHYRYDSLGNLAESETTGGQTLGFTSTPAGALATDSRGTTRLDERGHIRQLPDSPSPIDYEFNGAGELSVAVVNDKKLRYTYNALGLLTTRSVDGRETRYLPDPFADAWHPLWQRDPDGTETVTVWEGAVPLVQLQGKEFRFQLEDHLGSVRMEVDRSGSVAAWHDYAPYGKPEEAKRDGDLRPGFAGLFWDPTAKVYHAMARAYDPVTARFLQPDPQIRVPGASKHSHSLYAYTGGDPVNFVDRNGAEPIPFGNKWDSFRQEAGDWQRLIQSKEFWGSFGEGVVRDTKITWGFLSGLANPPLAKGNERPAVVRDLISRAIAESRKTDPEHRIDFEKASQIGRMWRNGKDSPNIREHPDWAYLVRYRDAVPPNPGELATAENTLMAMKLGADKYPVVDIGNTVGTAMIEGYRRVKFAAEMVGKTPNQVREMSFGILPIKGTTWRSTTELSYAMQKMGLLVGEQIKNRRFAESGNAHEGILSPIDIKPPKPSSSNPFPEIQPDARLRPEITQQSKELSSVIMRQIDTMSRIQQQYDIAGGTGRVAGPGGYASPGANSALADWNASRLTSPSPVGGVNLGGAGKAFEGLGQLKGVAVDETTGKLVLIGSDEQKIALSPLRLDDVVTVFRAVYNHGKSPSVTIDPDEEDLEGPTMYVKHGPGTESTYVGWILFECDRIMKCYQLGENNVTHAIVDSRVPGYAKTLDAVFFSDRKQKDEKDQNWERFWIVPAVVRRFDASKANLSLFELPLKVNTQKMRVKIEYKNGKTIKTLVDDENGQSSDGALAFKRWFSDHYDEIADEIRLTLPPGNGFKEPVAIFHELRRIALIAAVAERLRDQGEPMPAWMRDYPVSPFPVPKTTNSLTVEKRREDGSGSRIYGGVNLAPADRDVRTYDSAKRADAKPVPREDAAFVNLSRKESAFLTSKIPELIRAKAPIGTVQSVATPQGKKLSVAILPGARTRALAPNRQEVSDMVVPIGLDRSIRLTRHYNSFFDPEGAFGKGWTLNLPELLNTPVPVKRDGTRAEYGFVPHLVNPLGTMDIRFDETELVEPYGTELPVAKDHPEVVGVGRGESKIIGTKTRKVLFRDGTQWHFSDDGRLVLVQAEGAATEYVRDSSGRVQEIVGYVGTDRVAQIRLGYDPQGRIVEANANQRDDLRKQAPAEISKLNFEYGEDGRLRAVVRLESNEGRARRVDWTYSYEANHLARIGGADRVETSFGYDQRGQLLWKEQGDQKAQYTVTATSHGATLTCSTGEEDAQSEKWTYDAGMRPVEADLAGDRTVRWQYGKSNDVSETLSQDGKVILARSTSPDGRTETTVFADGPTYEVRKDAFGHPTTLSLDGVKIATISWQKDGTLAWLCSDDTEIQPLRHQDGWLNGVLISAPMISGETDEWIKEEWDLMGRPKKITDSSGFEYKLDYDDQGRLRTFGKMMKDGKMIATNLLYGGNNLVTGIDSPWGKERRKHGKNGILKSVKEERQGHKSATTYDKHGRPVRHSAFDGGTMTWRYGPDDEGATLRAIELPNGKEMKFASKESGETRSVDVGLGPVVVRTLSDARGRVTEMTWGEAVPRMVLSQ